GCSSYLRGGPVKWVGGRRRRLRGAPGEERAGDGQPDCRASQHGPPRGDLRGGKLEHEERSAWRARGEDLLADVTEERRRRDQAAGHDGDVLLAVELIGHGAGADSGARVELPEELPRAGIERLEPALNVAVE